MRKRALSVFVALSALLVMNSMAFPFTRSRNTIIDLLAHPERIEKGIGQEYAVSKSSWERSDLSDGTARWMAQLKDLYNYELIGVPLKKGTLLSGVSGQVDQSAELAIRAVLFMRAFEMSKDEAAEAFKRLLDSTSMDKGQKYYVEYGDLRAEMIFYDAMPMLLLIVKSL